MFILGRYNYKKNEMYWAGLILKHNKKEYDDQMTFVRVLDGQRGRRPVQKPCDKCKKEAAKLKRKRAK